MEGSSPIRLYYRSVVLPTVMAGLFAQLESAVNLAMNCYN